MIRGISIQCGGEITSACIASIVRCCLEMESDYNLARSTVGEGSRTSMENSALWFRRWEQATLSAKAHLMLLEGTAEAGIHNSTLTVFNFGSSHCTFQRVHDVNLPYLDSRCPDGWLAWPTVSVVLAWNKLLRPSTRKRGLPRQ